MLMSQYFLLQTLDCAKLHALCAFVPYVPSCLPGRSTLGLFQTQHSAEAC